MPHLLLSVLLPLVGGAGAAAGSPSTWVAPLGPPLVVLRAFAPPPAAAPWAPGHRGVDLAGAVGAPVRADAAGRVTFAGPVAGQGVVVVTHSARLRSTFEPVLITVRAGDVVRAGAQVGRLADVPRPAGWGPTCPGRPCLHWGMVLDGRYVDPLLTSRLDVEPLAGTARLLPLQGPDRLALAGPAPSAPGWIAGAAALGGDGAGPPGGSVSLALEGAVTTIGAVSVAMAVRRRRQSGPGP